MYKKEFSVTWGCESAIKKPSGGGKQEENIKLCQSSKKGYHPFFSATFPQQCPAFPLLLLPMLLPITPSCDVIITSVPGVVASTPKPSATADSPAPNQMMIDQLMTLQMLVTTAECRMILSLGHS